MNHLWNSTWFYEFCKIPKNSGLPKHQVGISNKLAFEETLTYNKFVMNQQRIMFDGVDNLGALLLFILFSGLAKMDGNDYCNPDY